MKEKGGCEGKDNSRSHSSREYMLYSLWRSSGNQAHTIHIDYQAAHLDTFVNWPRGYMHMEAGIQAYRQTLPGGLIKAKVKGQR